MGFERGIVEKNRALKGGGGQKENCGFKWGSPKKSSNFAVRTRSPKTTAKLI